MNIKKSMLVAGVVSTVALASVAGASAASNTSSTDKPDSLVNKIASKFNLKPAEVKSVFEQDRTEREAAHQQKITAKLDELVKAGTITSAQKDAILAKQAELKKEMQANHGSMKDKTPAEMKALMDQKKADLEQWAKDNGLSTDVLKQVIRGPGGHMGHGPMGGGMHGPDADDQAPAAPQEQ